MGLPGPLRAAPLELPLLGLHCGSVGVCDLGMLPHGLVKERHLLFGLWDPIEIVVVHKRICLFIDSGLGPGRSFSKSPKGFDAAKVIGIILWIDSEVSKQDSSFAHTSKPQYPVFQSLLFRPYEVQSGQQFRNSLTAH